MYDSVIRTIVPLIAGVLIAQAARVGLDLQVSAVTESLTALITAVYYVLARLLEVRRPALGRVLLSLGLSRRSPAYVTAEPVPSVPFGRADVRGEDGSQDVPQALGTVVESEVPDGDR